MAHHPSLRLKAVELRVRERLTIDEIADRLALPRTTIYYWVKDIAIERTTRQTAAQVRATKRQSRRCRLLREAAYAEGVAEFEGLATDPTFRDFVCMYIGEGYKRNRNCVALANSDPKVIALANKWITSYSRNPVVYSVQFHADQNLTELQRFWSTLVGVEPDEIKLQRKSNSKGLAARKWRSRYGVLTVRASDTMLRARLQGWIDSVTKSWV